MSVTPGNEFVSLSPTNNKEFDKNGYLVLRNLWNAEDLYCDPPKIKGIYNYFGNIDKFEHSSSEMQVEGSTSRYDYPPYKFIHSQIRLKIEKAIGNKLYNTYYFDRFYNPGQELRYHTDRMACEISCTVNISSNVSNPWPIWIRTPDEYGDIGEITKEGENRSVILLPGDGMVYKGCERPHWREPLPREYKRTWYGRRYEVEGLYFHQVFFHYVLANGVMAHHAWDRR